MSYFRMVVAVAVFCCASMASVAETPNETDRLRYIASPTVCQIHAAILSPSGEVVLNSSWRDGNVLDWAIDGNAVADGTHRAMITTKDLNGTTIEKELFLEVRHGRATLNPSAIETAKATLVTHDGERGSVITTTGDLTFRFGDVLSGKDEERLRITKDGLIKSNGIEFPDGTILTTAEGLPGAQNANHENSSAEAKRELAIIRRDVVVPAAATATSGRRLTPRSNAAADYQFKVDGTGVHIGTTPSFGLDVAGNVELSSNLILPFSTSASSGVLMFGGTSFLHSFGDFSNIFLGMSSGNFTTTGSLNTAVGEATMYKVTTGGSNVAVGRQALYSNTIGNFNIAIGRQTLWAATSGDSNIAIGGFALSAAGAIGSDNVAVGTSALSSNTGGSGNTAVGDEAIRLNNTGIWNTAIGYRALDSNTSGNYNIAIGENAGGALTTGCCNIDIGNGGVAGEASTIRIGNSNQTRAFISGIRGRTTGVQDAVAVVIDSAGQLGTISSSSRVKFDINDAGYATADLMRLRPVTFRYLQYGSDAKLQYGLIAEEVAEVYPELVARDAEGLPETVLYQFLPPMLLNEVQKQRRTIDELRSTIDWLAKRVDALEAQQRN